MSRKKRLTFPNAFGDANTGTEQNDVKDFGSPDDSQGKTGSDPDEKRLARSILDNDSTGMDNGDVVNEAINYNINAFAADLMFENIVKSYKNAERLYGPKLLRSITGFSAQALERNSKIPEFQKELKTNINSRIKSLKKDGVIDDQGEITTLGEDVAAIVLCMQELDKITPKSYFGEHVHKHLRDPSGVALDVRAFRSGDRYADIAIKSTIKTALRRAHRKITRHDLKVFDKYKKGNVTIIYAIDASGSMKGKKIEMCKRAGIALAHKASIQKNEVGLLVFSSQVTTKVEPTKEFKNILRSLTTVQASKETNIANVFEEAKQLCRHKKGSKHIIILTDGAPTVGHDPKKTTLHAAAQARAEGITTSVIGIQLLQDDVEFVQELVDVGGGRLSVVQNLDDLDVIVLQEYEAAS